MKNMYPILNISIQSANIIHFIIQHKDIQIGIEIDKTTNDGFILFKVKPVNDLKLCHFFIKFIDTTEYSSDYNYIMIIEFLPFGSLCQVNCIEKIIL